jgi:hypothetical protein
MSAELSDSNIAGPGVTAREIISSCTFLFFIGGPRFHYSGCIDILVVICVSFAAAKKRAKKFIATPGEQYRAPRHSLNRLLGTCG